MKLDKIAFCAVYRAGIRVRASVRPAGAGRRSSEQLHQTSNGFGIECPGCRAGSDPGSPPAHAAGDVVASGEPVGSVGCRGGFYPVQHLWLTAALPSRYTPAAPLNRAASQGVKGYFRRAVQANVYHGRSGTR